MPQHSGDDFEIERIGTGRNHQCAKLLDLARFECARLVVQCFQFSIIVPAIMPLTTQNDEIEEAGQAGVLTEIEITPAMVEAGVRFLWESGRLDVESAGPDQLLVRDLLRACLVRH